MKWFVKRNQLHKEQEKMVKLGLKPGVIGWGTGYVVIPPTHPWHGMPYEDIPVDAHGGLTFSDIITPEFLKFWDEPILTEDDIGHYVIGFDTAHLDDDMIRWPKEAVELATQDLAKQVLGRGKEFKHLF